MIFTVIGFSNILISRNPVKCNSLRNALPCDTSVGYFLGNLMESEKSCTSSLHKSSHTHTQSVFLSETDVCNVDTAVEVHLQLLSLLLITSICRSPSHIYTHTHQNNTDRQLRSLDAHGLTGPEARSHTHAHTHTRTHTHTHTHTHTQVSESACSGDSVALILSDLLLCHMGVVRECT